MGIHNFFPLITRQAPDAITDVDSAQFVRNKILGIDAPILLHRALAARPHGNGFMVFLAEQLLWLRGLECDAIFVFDGNQAARVKVAEREKREEKRRRQLELYHEWQAKMESADTWDEIVKCREKSETYYRAAITVTDQHRNQFQKLLDFFGWSWYQAPGEAEKFLSALQASEKIDFAITEDSDALICGATAIVRNFWGLSNSTASTQRIPPQIVRLEPILRALNVSAAALRTAAVLGGCDFAPKLRNIGLVRALKAVKTCGEDLHACLCALNFNAVAASPSELEVYQTAWALLESRAEDADGVVLSISEPPGKRPRFDVFFLELDASGEEDWELRSLLISRRLSFAQPLIASTWAITPQAEFRAEAFDKIIPYSAENSY